MHSNCYPDSSVEASACITLDIRVLFTLGSSIVVDAAMHEVHVCHGVRSAGSRGPDGHFGLPRVTQGVRFPRSSARRLVCVRAAPGCSIHGVP